MDKQSPVSPPQLDDEERIAAGMRPGFLMYNVSFADSGFNKEVKCMDLEQL
jgi:hypothetical protein